MLAAIAAALSAAALVNYVVAKRTESRNPPTRKFIMVDGVRLHYIERGTGMPVISLHGSGTSADDYDVSGVLDLVAKNHRVMRSTVSDARPSPGGADMRIGRLRA